MNSDAVRLLGTLCAGVLILLRTRSFNGSNSYWIFPVLILMVSCHDIVASYYIELNKELCGWR